MIENLFKRLKRKFVLLSKIEGRRQLEDIFLSKIRNYYALNRLTHGILPWKPLLVGIEPTTRCNLNCLICVRNYWDRSQNPVADMPIGFFREKIIPYLKGVRQVSLQILGEPLLSPDFFEMVKDSLLQGCQVSFFTNATLLDEDRARKIVELGINTVIVSIDGTINFEKIRGTKLELVIEGIKRLNHFKAILKKEKPYIIIAFVAMKENISDLIDIVELAYSLKIERVGVTHLIIHSRKLLNQSLLSYPELGQRHFVQAKKRAKELGTILSLPSLKEKIYFCSQPFTSMYINANGDVRPCCRATFNEKNTLKLGNVNEQSLEYFWNCPDMVALRRSLLKGINLVPLCQECGYRVTSLESHQDILD